MTRKRILGIDFDDVLADTNGSIADFHNLYYGTSYTREENGSYSFEDLWGCSREDIGKRLDHYYRTDFHHEAPITAGAAEALTALKERFDLVVITARPEERRAVTEAWLEKHLPGLIRKVYCSDFFLFGKPEKGVFKSDICRELGVSYLVEDVLYQVKDIREYAPDTEVFLLDSPWNRTETPPGVMRVHSWSEIARRLLAG